MTDDGPVLDIFGTVHSDRRSIVEAELEEFHADSDVDVLLVERVSDEAQQEETGELWRFVHQSFFYMCLMILKMVILPVQIVFSRDILSTEHEAVNRLHQKSGLPVHPVDEVFLKATFGRWWGIGNWFVLIIASVVIPFSVFAGLLLMLLVTILADVRMKGYRYISIGGGLLLFGGTVWAVLNVIPTSIFQPVFLLLGYGVVVLGVRRSFPSRNERMIQRATELAEEHEYDRMCLVVGKYHIPGLVQEATESPITVDRVHVRKWLREGQTLRDVEATETDGLLGRTKITVREKSVTQADD